VLPVAGQQTELRRLLKPIERADCDLNLRSRVTYLARMCDDLPLDPSEHTLEAHAFKMLASVMIVTNRGSCATREALRACVEKSPTPS
jgi:hypothetical protein